MQPRNRLPEIAKFAMICLGGFLALEFKMSLISNIQTGGGLVIAPSKAILPVAAHLPLPVDARPSIRFPPVTASPNSEAMLMETALPPTEDPLRTAGPQGDVEVDNIPTSGDEAVLTDDIDAPGAAFQPDLKPVGSEVLPTVVASQTLDDQAEDDAAPTHALTESAKRAYQAERMIAETFGSSGASLAELQDNSAKPASLAVPEDPIPQP